VGVHAPLAALSLFVTFRSSPSPPSSVYPRGTTSTFSRFFDEKRVRLDTVVTVRRGRQYSRVRRGGLDPVPTSP